MFLKIHGQAQADDLLQSRFPSHAPDYNLKLFFPRLSPNSVKPSLKKLHQCSEQSILQKQSADFRLTSTVIDNLRCKYDQN